jgi:hypothetical protein
MNEFTPIKNDLITKLCYEYNILNYTINDDGSVDVDGDVRIVKKGLTKLLFKFNKVSGDFEIPRNQLTTLEGCPNEVGGDFACEDNPITTLEYCPTTVGGNFYCSNTNINSLRFIPTGLSGYLSCSNCYLTSLEYCPVNLVSLYCVSNRITSLEYCPSKMLLMFDSFDNPLPKEFNDMCSYINKEEMKTFIQYQHYYEVWLPAFNIGNMNGLLVDIKDGLL